MVSTRPRAALAGVIALAAGALALGWRERRSRAAVDGVRSELVALAQRLNDERERTADAVHALRGPLTVMASEIDVSLRGEGLAPAARDLLTSVREEVDAMSRMVANLLTLAAIDEDRLQLRPVDLELLDAIEASARPFERVAAAKRLSLELGGEPCHARADPDRLAQALANLIDNAIKFTSPGGAVRVTAWCNAVEAGVTVTDSGPGVDAGARAQLFERFYRGPAKDSHGSGLGLAICKEIISAHGGRVWVDSGPGRGSAFTLALPRSADAPA